MELSPLDCIDERRFQAEDDREGSTDECDRWESKRIKRTERDVYLICVMSPSHISVDCTCENTSI